LAVVLALLGAGVGVLVWANTLADCGRPGGLFFSGCPESGLAALGGIALVVVALAVGLGFALFEAFGPDQDAR
jgi:hypothetical protein